MACYVTNYGQPPENFADQVDADNVVSNTGANATVAMEYSRVENPIGDPDEFPDNDRAVKFYVYDTANPDAGPLTQADLDQAFGDGDGPRPIPQLCMICHGGNLSSVAADPDNPTGPKKGAFVDRTDIMTMNSQFLPFDLRIYTFPVANSKAAQQAEFKGLNEDIVKEVALGTGATAISDLVDAFYEGGAAVQDEEAVVPGWEPADPASDHNKFYREVLAPTCRTCHISQPFGAPTFATKEDFHNQIGFIKQLVCNQKIMPHAQRTSEIFWTSLDPNMPAFLELYSQAITGNPAGANPCGQSFEAGAVIPLSGFNEIYSLLVTHCSGCHGSVGLANFAIDDGQTPAAKEATHNSILTTTSNGGQRYITPNNLGASLIYQRIITAAGRMPQGGPNLEVEDTDEDGITDAAEIANWINAGAIGP